MAKILIVDDHPHILRLLQRELELDSHRVCTAASGEEAHQQALQEQPDVVVLDVGLPGIDGFEVLELLRADPATRATVVIMLTAQDRAEAVTHGLLCGADCYVTKPFSPGEIGALIRRFLEIAATPATPGAKRAQRLPSAELDLLGSTVADALQMASRGAVLAGRSHLQAALTRAERVRGEAWGEELVQRHQEVLRDYADHFAAPRDAAPEALLC